MRVIRQRGKAGGVALGKLISETERVPAEQTNGDRGISDEDQIALPRAEPADGADEVLTRGDIQ